MTVVRVNYHRGRWHVAIDEDRYEDGRGYRLRRDAIVAGRALARYLGAELVPYRRFSGRFSKRDRDSYGNDRADRPG